MYATTSEATNTTAFCIWPNEASATQRDANELDLVARLQAGDERAFREIVDRYASKICRVSYGILRNRADADDIAQEVFAKVYFPIQGFGGRSSLYAWMYRITVNECYALLRKKRLKLADSSDFPDGTRALRMEAIVDGNPTPDRTAMQRDFINQLLARIPKDDRWLLISKEVEGFSGRKIHTIKIPSTTSRATPELFQARGQSRCERSTWS
jgi:RNA polymerase sigma-70 factor (ECF subfamily)